MADKQNTSISKNSSLLSISAFSKKLHTKALNTTCHKSVCKTSVEELAEEGYIFGRVLGEGSYSKVK